MRYPPGGQGFGVSEVRGAGLGNLEDFVVAVRIGRSTQVNLPPASHDLDARKCTASTSVWRVRHCTCTIHSQSLMKFSAEGLGAHAVQGSR